MDEPQTSYHYAVIERAIAEIDAAGGAQLSLEDLATRLSMSPAHFQKLFSRWVGVSPKRYQQYLTLENAKQMLAERHTLLDTALESGLSGTSRLHDLFTRWEAMSPGEYAKAGAGLTMAYGWVDTPFGQAIAVATDRGLAGLGFTGEMGRDWALNDMANRWPKARLVENPDALAPILDALANQSGDLTLHLIGAPFQIKVWEALLSVPEGHVTTYSDIAQHIGNPKAVRAVGTAVGRNPISWLIPCHRALRKSGALGGYHWGLPVKRALLAYEAAREDSRAA